MQRYLSSSCLVLSLSFPVMAQPTPPETTDPVEEAPATDAPPSTPATSEPESREDEEPGAPEESATPPEEAPPGSSTPEPPNPEDELDAASEEDGGKKKKKKDDAEASDSAKAARSLAPTEFAVKGRVITGWEYEDERPRGGQTGSDQTDFGFFLQQVRLGIEANWDKDLELELEVDFSSASPLRDAYLNYRFDRALQMRVGRFKRPFSRLELVGAGRLPIRSRGLGNGLIVEDLGYGDRSEGLELWGQLKSLGVDWSFSASDSPLRGQLVPGVDLHARLAYDAAKWLEVGLGGAHKIAENARTLQRDFIAGNAASADFRVRHGELYLLVDGMIGESLLFQNRPLVGSVGGYATYDVSVSDSFSLQPVLFVEWTDSDLEFSHSEVVRTVVGLNGLWQGHTFRVMPQVELIRPLEPSQTTPWVERDTYYVMFSGQL